MGENERRGRDGEMREREVERGVEPRVIISFS